MSIKGGLLTNGFQWAVLDGARIHCCLSMASPVSVQIMNTFMLFPTYVTFEGVLVKVAKFVLAKGFFMFYTLADQFLTCM